MSSPSIYKSEAAKAAILELYEQKLASLGMAYQEQKVATFAGATHVIQAGRTNKPPVVILHGINAGSPVALEVLQNLLEDYCVYAIDTVGQTTKSSETRLPLKDNSYGLWLKEVLEQLSIEKARFIGISYGAFLLQQLIQTAPAYIQQVIFVVPAGFVNGQFWPSLRKLSWPLMQYLWTKKEKHLATFVQAFYNGKDKNILTLQEHMLLGTHMDYRRPPLLKAENVAGFKAPVYILVAEEDIFFPGQAALAKCQALFENFQESYVLQNSKHVPPQELYPEIEQVLKKWLAAPLSS